MEQYDAQAIIEAVERLDEMEVIPLDLGEGLTNKSLVVLPNGKTIHSLKKFTDEYRKRPERKTGTARLTTLESFNRYTQRHMTTDSAVFVDDTNAAAPRIVSIFDAAHKEPDHQQHRAQYDFPLSDEWRKWASVAEKWLSQADFAAFIEDRIADVLDPAKAGDVAKVFAASVGTSLGSPARLLELSRGLSVSVNCEMRQHVNLGTGETQLVFKEEHKDENGAPLKFFTAFCIVIPVFKLGPAYSVPVRLRYRATSSKQVIWQVTLQRTDHVFENAIAEASRSVEEVTSLPVFRGKPD